MVPAETQPKPSRALRPYNSGRAGKKQSTKIKYCVPEIRAHITSGDREVSVSLPDLSSKAPPVPATNPSIVET